MKLIIAGTRSASLAEGLAAITNAVVATGWMDAITEVVSGRANGIDAAGERWAQDHNLPIRPFPADWGCLGKRAGPVRNTQMAQYADALLAFPRGESRGTWDMIGKMKAAGKPVMVFALS